MPPKETIVATQSLTLFLVLRAFASGSTALTGVEAISDGVPAFKSDEAKNASTTLLWMAGKAKDCGLALDPGRLLEVDEPDDDQRRAGVHVAPRFSKPPDDSMTRFYRLLGVLDRRLSDKRETPVDGLGLASSAARRRREVAGYDPPGLGEYIDAATPNIVPVPEGG